MSNSFKTFLKHTAKDFHNQSVNPPIVRASTIIFKSMQDIRKTQNKAKKNPTDGHFDYGRQGTSTTHILQQILSKLEESYFTFLTWSKRRWIAPSPTPQSSKASCGGYRAWRNLGRPTHNWTSMSSRRTSWGWRTARSASSWTERGSWKRGAIVAGRSTYTFTNTRSTLTPAKSGCM